MRQQIDALMQVAYTQSRIEREDVEGGTGKPINMHTENTVTVEAELPIQVFKQMHKLVEGGWYVDEADVLREALRRFLATHGPEIRERQIREDVAWGLFHAH